ncbi:FKBP-type peptidyl-prolyl cis-trans isomerase [Hymenobacter humi]|uniref:Peptidyl-prolyl cis-trans isomerase n=1 Tax=Hymenobacter humi TaxID=1411620 RepID=A0ABW2U5P7_9BACT
MRGGSGLDAAKSNLKIKVRPSSPTFTKKQAMRKPFSAAVLRLLFLALPASVALLTTACMKDPEVVMKDYGPIDEAIIKKYLDDSKITTAQRQPSGLYYVPVTTVPSGVKASAGDSVSVLYTGRFMDGRVFDASSLHGNKPITFILGRRQVIAGWDEGIALMRKGEKAELFIPSALAYGPYGAGGSIPQTPYCVLRLS